MELSGGPFQICSGCVLYQWDVNERVIVSKLDCSKIAPCSESISTMNIDERLSRKKRFFCDFFTKVLLGITVVLLGYSGTLPSDSSDVG